tara:strand:+ start:3484 stop:4251 length:768 start_codon:yes stop_codon:yes gene_type:complete
MLSGTGEGPRLASFLIEQGWAVTISVVSGQAALAYFDIPLKEIFIRRLAGKDDIKRILVKARLEHNGFDCVIDATHPFATIITSNLKDACIELRQNLIRFERPIQNKYNAKLIQDFSDLEKFDLRKERILFAIGSRHLKRAVLSARKSGAKVYARILANPESLLKALQSQIDESHLALMNPLKSNLQNSLEEALCRKWLITGVVCRQSGGDTEKLWQRICRFNNLSLWMVSRPDFLDGIQYVTTIEKLEECLLNL